MKNLNKGRVIASNIFSAGEYGSNTVSIHRFKSGWVVAIQCDKQQAQFDLGLTVSIGRQKSLLAHIFAWVRKQGNNWNEAHTIYEWCFSIVSEIMLKELTAGTIKAPHYYMTADYQDDEGMVVINIRNNSAVVKAMVSSLDLLEFLTLNPDTVIYDSLEVRFVEERLLWLRQAHDRNEYETSDIVKEVSIKTEYWATLLAEQSSDWWANWQDYGMEYDPVGYQRNLASAMRPAYIENQPKRLFAENLLDALHIEADRKLAGCATTLETSIYRSANSWIVALRIGADSVQLEIDLTTSIKSQVNFWHALCQWLIGLNFAESNRYIATPRADGSLSYSMLGDQDSGDYVVNVATKIFTWVVDTIGEVVVTALLHGDMTADHPYIFVDCNHIEDRAVVRLYRNTEHIQNLDSIETHYALMRNPDLVIYPSPDCKLIEKNHLLVGANHIKNKYFVRLGLSDITPFIPIRSFYWYDSIYYHRNEGNHTSWAFDGAFCSLSQRNK